MPTRAPGPGEQYRFHFDMGKCIGCKCCVVACNEQNGNPAAINWRRVGEIEGGWYPQAHRSYLSMGCNHCVEPTCMSGCPVDAFTKDAATGIVLHSADTCIGCQYCTWNCSYGVPQYNPERGVVGKCDLCHSRLVARPGAGLRQPPVRRAPFRSRSSTSPTGRRPRPPRCRRRACRSPIRAFRRRGLRCRRISPPNARPVDLVAPDAVGAALVAHHHDDAHAALGRNTRDDLAAATARRLDAPSAPRRSPRVLVGGLALAASTLHLGRPVHAYRALKMWRRSWLSREVLLFTAFSVVACVYAGGAVDVAAWRHRPSAR